MDSSSNKNLRQKFERKINSLKAASFDSLQQLLPQFWIYFNSEPVLQQIRENLIKDFPNISDKINQIFNSPSLIIKESSSELESIAIACEVLYGITKKDSFRIAMQASVSPSFVSPYDRLPQNEIDNRYANIFKELYLDKFFQYVDEQLELTEDNKKSMKSRYVEQEYSVLSSLVNKGNYSQTNISELMNSLSISSGDLEVILFDFQSKGWIDLIIGGDIQILPPGITAFHKWESINSSNSGNIYSNTFHAPVTGVQQGGQNNIQNNIQNINPNFTKAINDLLNLIENSSLNPVQKINTKSDVRAIQDLADLEKSPEALELANSKIDAVKEVISMTADMTSLGMILIPMLQAAFGS